MANFFGIYSGICVAVDLSTFRIRALVPQVLGSTAYTEWAYACMPPGWAQNLIQNHPSVTDSHGDSETIPAHVLKFHTPQEGDPVWIMFEGGDTSIPVWMGVRAK